jgi:integrase
MSPRTEDAYVGWLLRHHAFHGRQDPSQPGAEHVTSFLNALATRSRVSAATQNQALAALLFLYREVLGLDLPWLEGLVRARTPERLPVVLSRDEVLAVLGRMEGAPRRMATLFYGSGLRLLECCRLRVKDVDFGRNQIAVRRGKGDKDRVTMLPCAVRAALAEHLERAREQHLRDLAQGAGFVELPGALARKLPSAGREWPWQWVFPGDAHLRRAGRRGEATPPPARDGRSAGRAPGRPRIGNPEESHLPHVPPLVRDAPP